MAYAVGAPIDDPSTLGVSASAPRADVSLPSRRERDAPILVQYIPSDDLLKTTGLSPEQYDTYRHHMAKREAPSYSKPFEKTGSKTTLEVGGQYQMGPEEIASAAKHLGIDAPSKEEFLKNPHLQERLFDAYTVQHAQELMKNETFKEADPAKRAAILAGAHLGGVQGVEDYLAGKSDPSDKNKTTISNYVNSTARVMGAPLIGVSDWTPSNNAIASEQRRSNTDVVDMSPEQFLSLLPPIPKDEPSLAKRDNLQRSLASGDQIEQIPSLEVKSKGDDLKVVDHDGRHRAQAAIEAGLDTIPVSIRGADDVAGFKNLVGKTTVPIDFTKVASKLEQAPVQAPVQLQARPIGPQQVTQAPQQPSSPTVATAPIPPAPQTPSKPDFYPQIVAGINKDIINPASQGYRGVAVPNPTTDITAGQRIANANASSAGQVGLPSRNVLASALSAINPIGSAQAAEGSVGLSPNQPSASAPIPPVSSPQTSPSSGFAIGAPIESGNFAVGAPVGPNPRQSYVPTPEDVIPPIVNALSPMLGTGVMAGIAGLRNRPMSFDEWKAARDKALAETQLPETETGRKISKFFGAPGQLLGWAAEQVLGDKTKYLTPVMDVLAPASILAPGIGSVATAPIRPILNRALQTPEMGAVRAANAAYRSELPAGGVANTEIANRMAQAQGAGIPLTPKDMFLPGEAQNVRLAHALENSPEARKQIRDVSEARTRGTEVSPAQERVGGSLERGDAHVTNAFGSGSARDISEALNKNLTKNTSLLGQARTLLDESKTQLQDRIDTLKNIKVPSKQIKADPDVARLRTMRNRREAEVKDLNKKIDNDNASLDAVKEGQKIFSPNVRSEDVDKFVAKAKPEQLDAYRISVGDAVRDQFRRVRELGTETSKVSIPQNMKNKLSSALGSMQVAEGFMRKMALEDQVTAGAENVLTALGNEPGAVRRAGAPFRRALESLGHIGMSTAMGHGIHGAGYQAIRFGRNVLDYMAYGGGFMGRKRGTEISKLYTDPNANIATSGKNLFQSPALPARRQNILNTLPYGPAATYSATQNYAPNQ
jgi:hypothetical protein